MYNLSFFKKKHYLTKPTRPETRSDPEPFQPEPVLTRTRPTRTRFDLNQNNPLL
ncbi:hypothetical protein HanRHA438_Chr17g0831771 [Helianthus annuus]|uniref:Uncharacterized protein n=1 Tax=Helianthus annuus TaxID=4232 RepID=A0A9K3GWL6_HELAN|nr:hypothetical protein HanXRQr2_Chr17g0821841 [Helianthus annuus]KAJ0827958.1 hypothetical protein HanRHA438_Chr17g0831771 [Helianthus annuus]